MTYPIKTPKKLIEVALPLDDINIACAKEKQPGIGAHPRGLHLWWARRPLTAARAVIFAQMVNDPGYERSLGRGVNKKDAQIERERIFEIIRKLVKWENTNNEEVLAEARVEIWKSWRETCTLNKSHPDAITLFNPEKLPAFHDPFAGGGALPLEAQRLGLESYASDLNPVAVLINKAMIEIPPKFIGRAPVGPLSPATNKKTATNNVFEDWTGAKGLAEDVRRYGYWMREEAFKRIGYLYPKITITTEMAKERPDLVGFVGQELTVIAWLWARTVKCPNPACDCQMPLISSFVLSSKKGKEAYIVPSVINGVLHIDVSLEKPSNISAIDIKKGFKRGTSGIFKCVNCGTVTSRNYTSEQAKSIGLNSVQTAIVCKGGNGRVYLPAHFGKILVDIPEADKTGLQIEMSPNPRDVWCRNFGLNTPSDLFMPRQLLALTTFSDLVSEARSKVKSAALIAGMADDGQGLDAGGSGAMAYADAVAVYLAFAVIAWLTMAAPLQLGSLRVSK